MVTAAARAPVRRDITIFKGASYNLNVAIVNADSTARDLTGYAVRMQIRVDVDDASAVGTYGVGTGITMGAPVTGTFAVAIPDTDTVTWIANSYVYDIIIDNGTPSGVEVLLHGGITARKKTTA
jgi:hypothetical protein